MRKISADVLFPIHDAPLPQGVLLLDDEGRILGLGTRAEHPDAECLAGALLPGFVNAHCHLELSHMRGRVDTGTGLIPFITNVVRQRAADAAQIAAAIAAAEAEMWAGGIVAVGDISNQPDTFAAKAAGRLRYYTFVEMFDFLQDAEAEATFGRYLEVYEALPLAEGSRKSAVPHAPYSVSARLFALIKAHNAGPERLTVSIHNQETPPENALFEQGGGAFADFYAGFGISLADFSPTGRPSIHYALQHLDPAQRSLFVHNTLSTRADLQAAQAWSAHTYWCTCPNANLYIENRLPDYQAFRDCGARLCIGTDSLTSNWQLSILEEIKAIRRYQSYVPQAEVLRWATLNGAEALGFEADLGSFEPGKRPGLVHLSGCAEGGQITPGTQARRLL